MWDNIITVLEGLGILFISIGGIVVVIAALIVLVALVATGLERLAKMMK